MSNSIKLKNNIYLDSSSVSHNREKLSDVLEDSGWINLSLGTSFEAYPNQTVPAYRKIGKHVFLRGVIRAKNNIDVSSRTIATLPYTVTSQYSNSYFPCVMITGSTRVAVQVQYVKTGELLAPTSMLQNDWIPLDGIVITLD